MKVMRQNLKVLVERLQLVEEILQLHLAKVEAKVQRQLQQMMLHRLQLFASRLQMQGQLKKQLLLHCLVLTAAVLLRLGHFHQLVKELLRELDLQLQ